MPEASDNGDDNDLDKEYKYGDTDDLEIGAHYKNPFLTNAENKSCPNGWFAVNDLQPNAAVLGCYLQPHFNSNTVRFGVKILIPLNNCTDSVECE